MTTQAAISRRTTLLFAVAGGAAVGNLYWSQPLLNVIAEDLHSSTTTSGWLVTATQLGYAVGILLIVPLGDLLNRKRLIPAMMIAAAAALCWCGVAPTMPLLLAASALLGVTTVGGQLLTPLAGDLAADVERGRVVGTVASGILIGILVSRTISGFVADLAGWQTVYFGAAAVDLILAVLLYRSIPDRPANTTVTYPQLIGSVFTAVARQRPVRWTLALAGLAFGLFTMFWTALTFQLSGPPFTLPASMIGMFGLVGLAGAFAAQGAGKLHDRGWSLAATGASWVIVVATFAIAGLGGNSVWGLLVAILLLDVAIQAINILNQTRIFSLAPDARSRLNTALVTNNFIWGAMGSAATTWLWALGGWKTICTAGAVVATIAVLLWAIGRGGPLKTPPVPALDPRPDAGSHGHRQQGERR